VLRTSDCGTMYDAVLGVGFPTMPGHLMEERYVSRVRAIPPSSDTNDIDKAEGMKPTWMVEAKSIRSSSFDSLKSRWVLTFAVGGEELTVNDRRVDIGEDISCDVNFEVEIRVSNMLVSFVLDGVIGEVARKQVEAFERRANVVPFR
jgi:ribosome-associated toxin RatA of RatAB toxin-antitoxin module